jgi:putative peptidoglycan lipid II flippase
VRVVLGSGTFDWAATINTADALAFFSLGLLAQSLIHLLVRAFYALSNTKTPFIIGLIAELISIIAALLLMRPLGAPGLALAASIGVILNAVMLVVALRTYTQTLQEESLIPLIFKISIATLIMAVAVQALKYPLASIFDQQYFFGILGQGLVAGIAGLVIYCLLCYILKIPEFTQIKDSLKRRWLKPAQVNTTEVVELKD